MLRVQSPTAGTSSRYLSDTNTKLNRRMHYAERFYKCQAAQKKDAGPKSDAHLRSPRFLERAIAFFFFKNLLGLRLKPIATEGGVSTVIPFCLQPDVFRVSVFGPEVIDPVVIF